MFPLLVQGASTQEDRLPENVILLMFHKTLFIRGEPDVHQKKARLTNGVESRQLCTVSPLCAILRNISMR